MRIDSNMTTHCKRGHQRDGLNVYINPITGGHECLTCKRLRAKQQYNTLKAKAAEKRQQDRIAAAMREFDAEQQQKASAAVIDSQNGQPAAHNEQEDPYYQTDEYKLDCAIGQAVDKALSEGAKWTPELQRKIEQQFGLK